MKQTKEEINIKISPSFIIVVDGTLEEINTSWRNSKPVPVHIVVQ